MGRAWTLINPIFGDVSQVAEGVGLDDNEISIELCSL
jgi:hypothetical protein